MLCIYTQNEVILIRLLLVYITLSSFSLHGALIELSTILARVEKQIESEKYTRQA